MNYEEFLYKKTQLGGNHGFDPVMMHESLFDFQKYLVEWSLKQGRAAIFADCGLGKTFMQLVWAQNVVEKSNGRVLILTPLAVGLQTKEEGNRFGIDCSLSQGKTNRAGIYITNYEKLHLFNPTDFVAVICDESGILKHFSGATQKAVTRFMLKNPYRLLCTATPAPNDYFELGTSSEALGMLSHSDMLSRFFAMDDKKRQHTNDVKLARQVRSGQHFAKLSYRVAQQIGAWRLKGHAEEPFWKWVCSWSRACQKPSDLGFSDENFMLPRLIERQHTIEPKTPPDGMLFTVPAFGLREERDERRRTLEQRCEYVANLVNHKGPSIIWCHLNVEGDLLEKIIPDAVQVKGSQTNEEKEERLLAFTNGKIKTLVTKSKIAGFGMNWQHCNHVVTFATHSYEQYYQSVRRCWRFGQKQDVTVDIISTEGEIRIRENMIRKAEAASKMFANLTKHMNESLHVAGQEYNEEAQVPSWI